MTTEQHYPNQGQNSVNDRQIPILDRRRLSRWLVKYLSQPLREELT